MKPRRSNPANSSLANPAQLSPVAKPLLHALGTEALGNARAYEAGRERLAERGTRAKRDKGLKFLAPDAPIVHRQIDAMHRKPDGTRPQLRHRGLRAGIVLVRDSRFAGLALFPAVQFDHQIVRGVMERDELQIRLQAELRLPLKRRNLPLRQRREFRRVKGLEKKLGVKEEAAAK